MSDSKRFPVKKKTMMQTNAIMIHSSEVNTTFVKGVEAQKSKPVWESFMRPISFEGGAQALDHLAIEVDHLRKHEQA